MSVIAQQMNTIREVFVAEVFEVMRAEIQGLNYDTPMLGLWRASLTKSVEAGIEYLDRGTPAHLLEAPAAALAYARAAAQREVPLSALVRAHRIAHSRFLDAAMRHISLVEPELQLPTIIDLVNRSASFVDMVADQLTVA